MRGGFVVESASIKRFSGAHAFLSNFYPSPVLYDGQTWPTAEHAFQAAKTTSKAHRHAIRIAPSPGTAKRLGREVPLRPDWDRIKCDVMLEILRSKFRDPALAAALLATGDAELIEGNYWGDEYWGRVNMGDGPGLNRLGELLMQVREEMRG